MSKREQMVESLKDPEYRRALASDIETGLAFQIRLLRQKCRLTQKQLAQKMGKKQATISEWENPNYKGYTVNTIKALADAFDVVPIVRFGAFSELVDWMVELTPERLAPPSFEEDQALRERKQAGPESLIMELRSDDAVGGNERASMSTLRQAHEHLASALSDTPVADHSESGESEPTEERGTAKRGKTVQGSERFAGKAFASAA